MCTISTNTTIYMLVLITIDKSTTNLIFFSSISSKFFEVFPFPRWVSIRGNRFRLEIALIGCSCVALGLH
jgi:hypothetical protein